MLKRLELNNFKKHEHLVVDFTAGLNGIFGPNYRGKSTILTGVMFCLGGASAVSGMNLVTNGKNTGFKQTLWFEADGKEYFIERGKTSAKIFAGSNDEGELLASGTSPVNERVEAILGMPVKMFKQLRYGQQKKTDAILTMGAASLHKLIEQLTGAEEVNNALLRLSDMRKELDGAIGALTYVDTAELYAKRSNLESDKSVKEKHLDELSTASDSASMEVCVHDNELRKHEAQQNAHNAWSVSSASLKSRIEKAEKDAASFSEAASNNMTALSALPEEDILRKGKVTLEGEIKALIEIENEIRSSDKAVRRAKDNFDSINAQIGKVVWPERLVTEEDLSKATDKVNSYKSSQQELTSKVSSIKADLEGDSCSACGRPFDRDESRESHINRHRKELEKLEEKLSDINKLLATAEPELEQIKQNHKAMAKVVSTLDSLSSQLEVAKGNLTAAEADLAAAVARKAKPDVLDGEELQPIDRKKELEEIERNLSAITAINTKLKMNTSQRDKAVSELEECKAKLASLECPAYSPVNHAACKTILQEAIAKAQVARNAVVEARAEVSKVVSQIEAVTTAITVAEEGNAVIKKYEVKHKAVTELTKFLRDNRDRYMTDIWSGFMASASEFTSSCTNGTIECVTRSEDGEFSYRENDYDMSINDASGAQRSIMGLAVQMALSDAAACPLDVIMIDEPAADMDPEHSMAMAVMLASRGKQVIMISHSQMDNSVCENVIAL